MNFNSQKEAFLELCDKEQEKAQSRIARAFQKIVQTQLDEWSKSFHNHSFYAFDSNGSLSFEMHPPFKRCANNSLAGHFDYIPGYYNRGAVAEMLNEAEQLKDLYCEEMSLRPGFYSATAIKGKK